MSETKTGIVQPSVEPFKIKGNWDSQTKSLKEKYSQLTDSDLKCDAGKEEEMIGRVSTRLNKGREEVISMLRLGQTAKV
ncbi:MAG: hypothetical protein IPP69_08580 [Flavobacteriales bacterium]|nr:hypothetical protein [Flavobacteriales bacterium]